MNLVVFFDQAEAGLGSLVGGKGSNLHVLSAAGFPVPPGFVVTAAAYDTFLRCADWLDKELATVDFDHPDRLCTQCAELRQRLSRIELPAPVRESLRAAVGRLDHADNDAFAVRSSSTFEDLAQASFAGQHDTYLNIRGADSICRRVRDCFVSLWGDRAVAYRHHQGFSQREARMAVVVQRQIECDVAGVGFSINPISGRFDRMLLNANYGLGESVVSGECEVDQFELEKETLAVSHRSIGHKEHMVMPAKPRAEGGAPGATANGQNCGDVTNAEVPAELADVPCLSDAQVLAVGQLLKKVESHYGWPQDIEWGLKDGTIYLLQSRPVTTVEPRWTRDESAERFPIAITPLCWDFISVAFRRSLAHSLRLMGLPPFRGDWFAVFDNYVYGNQSLVQLVASYRPLRARSIAELVGEIPELRTRYAWVLDLPVEWARDLDRYLVRLGRLTAVSLDGASVQEIWRHVNEALDVASDYFLPNIAISMTQSFLHRMLHALVGMAAGDERALGLVDGLLAGCETKTAQVNREIHGLAKLARQIPALEPLLVNQSSREIWDRGELSPFPEFGQRFERFLDDHGHREIDMDYYCPTWAAQPWVVIDSIALLLRGDEGDDPDETAHAHRQRYFATEHQFLSAVPEPLRFFFRELIRLTRTYTVLDDLEHYETTRINPIARRAAIALGGRLQDAGILDAPDDVFFFSKEDLEKLVADFPKVERAIYRRMAYDGKRSYEGSLRQSAPWTPGQPAAPAETGANNAMLRGLPGSPGRVTGPCFHVHSPADFARFPKRAILVARTTNPAWTSLFYTAAGLITESGGPLSHGAVTAREMKLPAVMSVRGAMSALQSGQVVTVDGTQGIVEVGDDA
ncbi:MAG TPA: PEP/pyruvate-binding domain-containing protein [Pirellulales bacterium]|jgi:pyruvate,water dikinase|nr:PEP/pyruvate-binding domain-containing protein [Pirellulales bacterium]